MCQGMKKKYYSYHFTCHTSNTILQVTSVIGQYRTLDEASPEVAL
jgi:hypothetical protein